MENTYTKELHLRLERLEDFMYGGSEHDYSKVLDWIAECVAFFSELGVNDTIINAFMGAFDFRAQDGLIGEIKGVEQIGPFSKVKGGKFKLFKRSTLFGPSERGTRILFNITIAFTTANSLIRKMADEERLVPSYLVVILSENPRYQHLVTSLKLIEKTYEDRNSSGIMQNSCTLLDSILDLCPELKKKSDLGPKLTALIENHNTETRDKFGVSADYIRALNHGRIIRNLTTHKNTPVKHNIPLMVATSFAHLVIIFLDITISNGEYIK